MLPLANPRHSHGRAVFRDVPLAADQSLIVGVIDTTTNFVEHPEVIAERLEKAAEAIGDPAGRGDEHRERQHVRGEGQLKHDRVLMQAERDRRQRS